MEFPFTVGGGVLPEYRRDQFKDEEHEYLVAVSDETVDSGEKVGGGFYASTAIIGAIDLTTGVRESGRTIMIWEPTEDEQRDGSFRTLFRELEIYRVKGHPPVKPWYSSPKVRMGGMYLTAVCGQAVHPYLKRVIREYRESLYLHSELLGYLELSDDGYAGRFSWLGTEIRIVVSTEYDPPTRPLAFLEAFCRDCERHDEELRRFAAGSPEVGETIAREMQPEEVYMYYDGDYDAYYKFGKYTIDIFGERSGPEKVWKTDY